MKKMIKEAIIRFKSDTPTFFKKIRAIGASSIALGIAIIGIPSAVNETGLAMTITLSEIVNTMASYLIVGGIAAVKIASLAVTDNSVLNNKEDEKSLKK